MTFIEGPFQNIVGIHFPQANKHLLIIQARTAAWTDTGFLGPVADLRIDTVTVIGGTASLFVPGAFAGGSGPLSIQSVPVVGPIIAHGGSNINDQTIPITAAMLASGGYQQIEYDQRGDTNVHPLANLLNNMIFNLTELKRLGGSVLSLAGSYDRHGNTNATDFEVDIQIVKLTSADLPFDAWTFATGTVLEAHTLSLGTGGGAFGVSTDWTCDVNLTSKTITSLTGAAWVP